MCCKCKGPGGSYVRERYCNLHNSELARDTKVPFGYYVFLLVGYMHSKNQPISEESAINMVGEQIFGIHVDHQHSYTTYNGQFGITSQFREM
jgi:hypothetical protein